MKTFINQLWINSLKQRYYRAYLCTDLFGDVSLQRSWGSLHTAQGGSKQELLESWQSGLDRLDSITQQRQKRGYEAAN